MNRNESSISSGGNVYRRNAPINYRQIRSNVSVPFALFIEDPKGNAGGNAGKASPGAPTYKKLVLNPAATSAERQAQLLLFQDLIVGFQHKEDSRVVFRSNLKQAVELAHGLRTIKFKVMMLPSLSQNIHEEPNKLPDILEASNQTSKKHKDSEDNLSLDFKKTPEFLEEESMKIEDAEFVSEEAFEQLFNLAFQTSVEEEKTVKEKHVENDQTETERANAKNIDKPQRKAAQTTHSATKTRNFAVNTLLDAAVEKAHEAKRKFNEKEKEKDEIAAERERKNVKADTHKAEIKNKRVKKAAKSKVGDKEQTANVTYNKEVLEGKNPSIATKFKLPGGE